jgi:hypothetical protein
MCGRLIIVQVLPGSVRVLGHAAGKMHALMLVSEQQRGRIGRISVLILHHVLMEQDLGV